jgi:hypothetical protein
MVHESHGNVQKRSTALRIRPVKSKLSERLRKNMSTTGEPQILLQSWFKLGKQQRLSSTCGRPCMWISYGYLPILLSSLILGMGRLHVGLTAVWKVYFFAFCICRVDSNMECRIAKIEDINYWSCHIIWSQD